MNKVKRLTALLMTLALLLTMAACSGGDISWAAKLGNLSLPGGVYNQYLLMGYNQASQLVNSLSDNILREKIDGQLVADYIVAYAKREAAKSLSTQEQFQKLGLTINEEELAGELDYAAYVYSYNQYYYRANKITEDDMKYIFTSYYMELQVFLSIYGPGGEKEVPRQDLMDTFTVGNTRSQFILFYKVDPDTGEPLPEAELDAIKAEAADYLARAGQEGQSFTDLIHELDLSNLAEGQEPFDKQEESVYDLYLANLANQYPTIYETTVLMMEPGSVEMVEDETFIFIIKKLDILDAAPEALDTQLRTVLQNLKYQEFLATVDTWGDRTDIVYNNAALAELTPKKLKVTETQISAALLAESSSSSSSSSSSGSDSPSSGTGSSTS